MAENSQHKRGLSLVEILLVVAIIGVLVAIGVVALNQYRVSMVEVKNKRNAQSIVSIFRAAQSAGLQFYQTGNTIEQVVRSVVNGGAVPDGPFAGQVYGVQGLSEKEIGGALEFLQLNADQKLLIYLESGGGPTMIGP